MKNKISIIIPVLNEEKYIKEILKKIKIQNFKPYEIIIVDSKSTDNTKQESFNIINKLNYLYSAISSPAEQRNYGAANAKGNILIFLDADTKIPKNFLYKINNYYKNKKHNETTIFPLYIPETINPLLIIMFLIQNIIFIIFQYIKPVLAGPCIVVPKKIFIEIQGFKNNKRFEDLYFAKELSKKYKIRGPISFIFLSTRRFKNIFTFFYTFFLYIIILCLAIFNIHPSKKWIYYEFNEKNKLY